MNNKKKHTIKYGMLLTMILFLGALASCGLRKTNISDMGEAQAAAPTAQMVEQEVTAVNEPEETGPVDEEAPIISGVRERGILTGTQIDPAEGVTVFDEIDADVELLVDIGEFDENKPGDYTIYYHAMDDAGNNAVEHGVIHVYESAAWYTVPGTEFSFDATGIADQPYLVAVNRELNVVTVYAKDECGNYTIPDRAFVCSVGGEWTGTPSGRFVTEERYDWRLMIDNTYARCAIRVWRGIMFHSVGYYSKHADRLEYEEYNKLGTGASLGCIRLCYRDANWIYTNCPTGFVTIIYDDATSPGPLGKPEIEPIDTENEELRGWDPTDPEYPGAIDASGDAQ